MVNPAAHAGDKNVGLSPETRQRGEGGGGGGGRRQGRRHSVKTKVHTAAANECMESEKGAKCSEISFFS